MILFAESVLVDTVVLGLRLGGPTLTPEMVTVKVPAGMPSVGVAVRMTAEPDAATLNRSVGVMEREPEARNNPELIVTMWF